MKIKHLLIWLISISLMTACNNQAREGKDKGGDVPSVSNKGKNDKTEKVRDPKIDCNFNLKPEQMGRVKRAMASNREMKERIKKVRPHKPPKYRPDPPVVPEDPTNPEPPTDPVDPQPPTPEDPQPPTDPEPPTDPVDPQPPATENTHLVLVDFNGHTTQSPYWNGGQALIMEHANMTVEAMQLVVDNVARLWGANFTVEVTADESRWNAYPSGKRHRNVVTTSSSWYGMAGGVAYVGSMTSDVESFTFSQLLNYDAKFVGEAAAHEIGHAMGLHHIAQVDESNGDCRVVSHYHPGNGEWAWVMGVGYYAKTSILGTLSAAGDSRGKTSFCQYQDDIRTVAQIVSLRPARSSAMVRREKETNG